MNSIYDLIASLSLASTLGGFIYVGRKLQILDDLYKTQNVMKENIKVISDFLINNSFGFDPSQLKSYSPLKLTQQGLDFINELGFDRVFRQNKNDFFEYIKNQGPKVEYDVEKAANKALYVLSDKEYMNFLKDYLYSHPDRALHRIFTTFSVFIRDEYLKENKF